MNTVTISKREYEELLSVKTRVSESGADISKILPKKPFKDTAFGVLKNTFGKKSSVSYVATLRKSWR